MEHACSCYAQGLLHGATAATALVFALALAIGLGRTTLARFRL
jgi:hypothetical protein